MTSTSREDTAKVLMKNHRSEVRRYNFGGRFRCGDVHDLHAVIICHYHIAVCLTIGVQVRVGVG